MAQGLCYIHHKKLVNRDIKPENVLISLPNEEGQVQLKISDFGLCKSTTERGTFSVSGVKGTLIYLSPEILKVNENWISLVIEVRWLAMCSLSGALSFTFWPKECIRSEIHRISFRPIFSLEKWIWAVSLHWSFTLVTCFDWHTSAWFVCELPFHQHPFWSSYKKKIKIITPMVFSELS